MIRFVRRILVRCTPKVGGHDGRSCVAESSCDLGENAVHGSDSEENAQIEIAYFFSKLELV